MTGVPRSQGVMHRSRSLDAADELFGRHLDLRPLGHRRRGQIRCIFHEDRTPSLSVDLDRGLFHCFGCNVGGGQRRFSELVGEAPSRDASARRDYRPPLEEARVAILREARSQPWAREEVRLLYFISSAISRRRRAVDLARDAATHAGDRPESWDLLAKAARIDVEADVIEAELEETLA
jgi:CHC2 zinc finger